MGCKNSKSDSNAFDFAQNFARHVQECIDNGNSYKLKVYLESDDFSKNNSVKSLETLQIKHKSLLLNPLSYSLIKNKNSVFRFLLCIGLPIKAMEENLYQYQIFPINLICARGSIETLEIYLPYYLSNSQVEKNSIDNKNSEYCIHTAAKFGQLGIIDNIRTHFAGKNQCPVEFDLKSCDLNGEDCAMLACRFGNLRLIQYLYTKCEEKFDKMNNYEENCLMLCIRGFKKNRKFIYYECLEYLINVVHVDITYRYADLLKIIDNNEIYNIIKEGLLNQNIDIKSFQIGVEIPDLSTFFSFSQNMIDLLRPNSFNSSVLASSESIHRNSSIF